MKEQIELLEQRAESIREVAEKLTRRWERFEMWLTQQKGHANASYTEGELTIFAKRRGKGWFIGCLRDGQEIELRDAPILFRAEAVKLIPGLLEAMADVHAERIKEMKRACEEFDAVFIKLGIPSIQE